MTISHWVRKDRPNRLCSNERLVTLHLAIMPYNRAHRTAKF